MKESFGTLLYRLGDDGSIEVLLVHPSGNYNRHAPWSIPKGLAEPGEKGEDAARRETAEETGVKAGDLKLLATTVYKKSRKKIYCYFGRAGDETPRCASWEVDRAEFLPLTVAKKLIHPDQLIFLNELKTKLRS